MTYSVNEKTARESEEMKEPGVRILGDGEYHLMKDEFARGCCPALVAFGRTLDGREMPAIILRERLKNREKYKDAVVDSTWSMAQSFGRVEAIYLDMEFKGVGKLRICMDESMFGEELLEWFRMLIGTEGTLMLHDREELGKVEAIGVTGIPLDIPKMLVEKVMWVS